MFRQAAIGLIRPDQLFVFFEGSDVFCRQFVRRLCVFNQLRFRLPNLVIDLIDDGDDSCDRRLLVEFFFDQVLIDERLPRLDRNRLKIVNRLERLVDIRHVAIDFD